MGDRQLRGARRGIRGQGAWNIWQMDGLKDTVPLGKPYEENHQMVIPEFPTDMSGENDDEPEVLPCKIYDWRRDNSVLFKKLKEMRDMGKNCLKLKQIL